MKRLLLTALLIVTANTASALQLAINHNKDLPTPHELIAKGKILHEQYDEDFATLYYFIAWDKTKDIYSCSIRRVFDNGKNISYASYSIHEQDTGT